MTLLGLPSQELVNTLEKGEMSIREEYKKAIIAALGSGYEVEEVGLVSIDVRRKGKGRVEALENYLYTLKKQGTGISPKNVLLR
jgi:hypothetical protein